MIIFEHNMAAWLIGAGVAVAAALSAYTLYRYVRPPLTSVLLGALRLLFLALLAWCLLQPARRDTLKQISKPRFIVALDASGSMALSPPGTPTNRWDEAARALNQPWAQAVGAECDLDAYAFSIEPGSRVGLDGLKGLAPDGEATFLRQSAEKLMERYRGQSVAGMLLLSDGLDTRETSRDWASAQWPWPIYTVRLESPAAWAVEPDLRIDTVQTPRRVTVGWNTDLKAVVSGQGAGGAAVVLRLFKDERLAQEMPLSIPQQGGSREAVFPLKHEAVGLSTYRLELPPLAGETRTNDNRYAVAVQVMDARNRLLYVEGTPRWESKYLTRTLQTTSRVTPLCFLRGPGGRFLTIGPRGSITPDMTPEQLALFRIVVIGNLTAAEIGAERAVALEKFVEAGGSMVFLGGSRAWAADGFFASPLAALIPLRAAGGAALAGKFPSAVTDEGLSHPVFAGEPGLWADLPPVLSLFPHELSGAGAQTLATAETEAGAVPLVVVHRYGQGRVVAILTDSLWRWQLSPRTGEAQPYQRFWEQLLAWLAPEQEAAEPYRVELFASREDVFLGDPIDLSARFSSRTRDEPQGVACTVTTPDGRRLPLDMPKRDVVTASGQAFPGFAAAFTASAPGLHTAVASCNVDGRKVESDPVSFFVKPFTPESVPRPADAEVLAALANASGGRYCETVGELNDVLAALSVQTVEQESVSYRSLWQTVLVIACLMLLLAVDWSLRKLKNLP